MTFFFSSGIVFRIRIVRLLQNSKSLLSFSLDRARDPFHVDFFSPTFSYPCCGTKVVRSGMLCAEVTMSSGKTNSDWIRIIILGNLQYKFAFLFFLEAPHQIDHVFEDWIAKNIQSVERNYNKFWRERQRVESRVGHKTTFLLLAFVGRVSIGWPCGYMFKRMKTKNKETNYVQKIRKSLAFSVGAWATALADRLSKCLALGGKCGSFMCASVMVEVTVAVRFVWNIAIFTATQ